MHFGNNQNVVNLIKGDQYSVGIGSQFTDIDFDFYEAARKEINIEDNYVLDFNSVDSVQYIYAEYIEQLTRWNISNVNFPDPINLYDDFLNSLNYWYSFLKYFDINKIFIYEDPHRAFDLLIYTLAKYLKIKVYIFSELNMGYRTYIKENIFDSLSDVKGGFQASNKNNTTSLKYNHYTRQFSFNKKGLKGWMREFKRIFKLFTYFDSYIYINKEAFSEVTYFTHYVWLINSYLSTAKYRFYYKRAVKSPIILDEDIVFYLHYQPERTSNPVAGSARNQLQCIKILRKAFPDKNIYIKEHPSQLNLLNPHKNRQIRNNAFIDQIESISNGFIDVIPKNTKYIGATLHGTIGLELALEGNTVLCLGNPWYAFLKNVHVIRDSSDLRKVVVQQFNPYEIQKEMNNVLHLKSAKGTISNKLEGFSESNTPEGDIELLDYVEWYFNIKKNNFSQIKEIK
jgi:hypothetical protein